MFCAAPEAKTKYRSIWDYRRGRVPTQQKNFLSTRAVQKWFAYVVAHCPSLEVLRQSYFLAEEVGGGGLLLNTSSSRYERPLESSLGLRFQAVIRHTPLPPVVHTRRMHSKLFFPHSGDTFVLSQPHPQLNPLLAEETCLWMNWSSYGLRVKFFPGLEPGTVAFAPTR